MRQIAREEGYSRPTIEKAITNQLHNPYRLTRAKPAPIFGPYKERVEALLHQNEQMPRKQRYTVHRIFEVIQAEGYQGSESRLRQYVATRRSATQIPEVFLPLEFEPGQDAQVDWGEAVASIGGQKQKVQVFVMHLCYSRRTYAACFPSQNQESFLWAHIQAFRHFGGVPRRISYDNLATAVKLIVDKTKKRGRSRQEARAFTSFRGYYLFESHFCTPAFNHSTISQDESPQTDIASYEMVVCMLLGRGILFRPRRGGFTYLGSEHDRSFSNQLACEDASFLRRSSVHRSSSLPKFGKDAGRGLLFFIDQVRIPKEPPTRSGSFMAQVEPPQVALLPHAVPLRRVG